MTIKSNRLSPNISSHLLWEYDLSKFNFGKSKKIVIERVIQRGTLKDWREIIRFFGKDELLKVARSSKQLSPKDKNFTEVFIYSKLVYAG